MPKAVAFNFQKKVINYVGYSGMAFLSLFGINAFLKERLDLALIIFALTTLTAVFLWLMHRYKSITIGQNGLTAAVIFMMLYLIYTGGYEHTGPLWGYPAVIVVVLLQGFKRGLFILPLLILTVALIFLLHPIHSTSYSEAYQIRYIASLLVITIMALLYEYQRHHAQQQIVEINEQLHLTSSQDSLTGLLNRRAVENVLEKEHAEFIRHKTPFTVIMLDIDHFKNINDGYGHSVGDSVLIEIAKTLTEHTRINDSVARWGGEEFLIVLPNSNLHAAVQTAEKIREQLKSLDYQSLGLQTPITSSFGVHEIGENNNLEDLLKATDNKLYRAKDLGRDRVVY